MCPLTQQTPLLYPASSCTCSIINKWKHKKMKKIPGREKKMFTGPRQQQTHMQRALQYRDLFARLL